MSKKLKAYLTKLGIENIDEVITAINADDDNEEIIEKVLKQSQAYSKPFLKAEFAAEFATERSAMKGKYFKESAQKANKAFGSPLTNKELDDIMADPDNISEKKTLDAVLDAIRDKSTALGGKTDTEMKKMLEAANSENATLKTTLAQKEEQFTKDIADAVGKVKLDSVLHKKLTEILPKYTSMNPVKAAELLIERIGKKAVLKLADDNNITLFDPTDPEKQLKKSETEFATLEGFVSDMAKEYELPVNASPEGSKRKQADDKKTDDTANTPKIADNAAGPFLLKIGRAHV